MKPTIAALIIIAAALALSGEPPKPVAASLIDRSAEVASLKAELESLRAELAQANLTRVPPVSPEPVALVVSTPTASGGGVCANGSCAAAGTLGIFRGERRPVRRLFSRVPRLFGRR